MQQHAARGLHGFFLRKGLAQRAGLGRLSVRGDQAHHLVHIAARGVKPLPAGQALRHGVQVGDHALCIGADHGIANRLECQAHALLFLEQRFFHALALGDVGHLHKNATHLVAIHIGHIRGDGVALRARGVHDGALEKLFVALQRMFQIRPVLFVQFLAQQLADMPAAHFTGRLAKPLHIGMVGKAVVQLAIPVTNHGRQVVQDGAQVVLGLLQLGAHLLAAAQLACKKHRQPHAGGHQHQGKAA